MTDKRSDPTRVTRRRLLAGAGTLGVGVVAGGAAGFAVRGNASSNQLSTPTSDVVPFHGDVQAGIVTDAQDRLAFASYTLAPGATVADVRTMLRDWTSAAVRLTQGLPVGPSDQPSVPTSDTGETTGSAPGRLTLTVGFGPSFFDNRLGLGARKPRALADLPPLPNEDLDPAYGGGDLCIQACSDDPLVAFHAVRNLTRIGMGVVGLSWTEFGFGRTSTTSTTQSTPRNLLGFKDGTRNVKAQDTDLLDQFVWVGAETDQQWLRGGTFLVARRIRMFLENWDRDFLADQENVIGRSKVSGAPLSGGVEGTAPDFAAKTADGVLAIPQTAHIRLASFEGNNGVRILRRGYSFTDGVDPVSGSLLGGLFFISFMKNPTQFAQLQTALGASDALNTYIRHIGSAVFACPPGVSPSGYWGDALLSGF